jgi:hypothetical protein
MEMEKLFERLVAKMDAKRKADKEEMEADRRAWREKADADRKAWQEEMAAW